MQETSRAHWVLLIACIGAGCGVKLPENPRCAVTTDCSKGQRCDVADRTCRAERTKDKDAAISDQDGSDAAVDGRAAGATGAGEAPMSNAGDTGSKMLAEMGAAGASSGEDTAQSPDAGMRSDERDAAIQSNDSGTDSGMKDGTKQCAEGLADCNGDLAARSSGDHCETSVGDDVDHCGDCTTRCAAGPYTLAACESGHCYQVGSTIDDSSLWMSSAYGSPDAGNYAYQLDCDAGQLLVGLHVETQKSTGALLGLGAFCGHPTLTQNGEGQFVLGHADDRLIAVYGNDQKMEAADSLDFGCKSDETITSLSVIQGDVVVAPVKYTKTVTQIDITCSKGLLNTASTFTFVASRVLSSNASHPALTGVRTDISCPPGQVVVDLRGKSGGAIDAMWMICAPLSLGVSPVR